MLTFRFLCPLSLIQSGKSGSDGGYGSASGDSKAGKVSGSDSKSGKGGSGYGGTFLHVPCISYVSLCQVCF